jgi:hypothetical protein
MSSVGDKMLLNKERIIAICDNRDAPSKYLILNERSPA